MGRYFKAYPGFYYNYSKKEVSMLKFKKWRKKLRKQDVR